MDPARVCPRCGAGFRAPSYLKAHLGRKTPCAPILDQEDLAAAVRADPLLARKRCRFCGRVLSSYNSMRRHVREACKIAPTAKNGTAGLELLYEHTLRRQQARLDAVEAQVAEQRAALARLGGGGPAAGPAAPAAPAGPAAPAAAAPRTHVQIRGSHNRVLVDNRTFVVNAFGAEGVGHITAAQVRQILDESAGPGAPRAAASRAAVVKAAMLIYSDPAHPENLTCYLPNKKANEAMVHTAAGWEIRPIALALAPIARRSLDVLFAHQPCEPKYGPLMADLRDNEEAYAREEKDLRALLARNKLLLRALRGLPRRPGAEKPPGDG